MLETKAVITEMEKGEILNFLPAKVESTNVPAINLTYCSDFGLPLRHF